MKICSRLYNRYLTYNLFKDLATDIRKIGSSLFCGSTISNKEKILLNTPTKETEKERERERERGE